MTVKISIVIPTRNRCEKLKKTLQSVYKQAIDVDCWELIVINNGSADDTKKICEEYTRKYKNFKYHYAITPGLHIGRNMGLLKSRGGIVAYLDDDVILFPKWLETVLKVFEDEKVMAACGCVVPYDFSILPDTLWKHKCRIDGFEVLLPISCFWQRGINENVETTREVRPELIFGANAIYRKSVLEECKGFHPDGMPKDLLMYRGDGETYIANWLRMNKAKVVYNSQISVYHMIDGERVDDSYLTYMFYRNGISAMYTCLRLNHSFIRSVSTGIRQIIEEGFYNQNEMSYLKGECYLLVQYMFRSEIRRWIYRENYFEEEYGDCN